MPHTWRPSTSPWPVTTPSAGVPSGSASPPRTGCWWASSPSSTNVSSSKRRSSRSRTVSLPRWCCLAIFSSPPMARFLARLDFRSVIRAGYSSPTRGILLTDQEVGSLAPPIEEAVHVSLRQALSLLGIGRLPQPMLVFLERQVPPHQGTTASIPPPDAEPRVGDPIELKPRVESLEGLGIGAAKGHAVALDGVHLRPRARGELFRSALAAQAVRPGHHDRRISQRLDEGRHGVAGQVHARVEEDHNLTRGGFDAL